MATYNGERYVLDQLHSVLCQLAPDDEVIIVDDASSDQTPDLIGTVQDIRVHLIKHKNNRGVLATFEEAILKARGDIIFLCDQDDLWEPDKVFVMLEAFKQHPESIVVVSNASCIDENGTLTAPSFFAKRPFTAGVTANLIHARFVGCLMAFRAHLRSRVLPFPNGYDVFHDIWIGTRNTISGGETLYIDKPLILHRRHSANLTSGVRLSRPRQLRVRFHLILALGGYWLKNTLARHPEQE
jgi:glycosyltransferase involved in cell wall biosynthesis